MGWPAPSDYDASVQNPRQSFSDPELVPCTVATGPLGLPKVASGNFASVYQFRHGEACFAVRCFLREVSDHRLRYEMLSDHLSGLSLPYLVGFEYLDEGIRVGGQWYPIVKMEWVEGRPLHMVVGELLGRPAKLLGLARQWRGLVATLHGLHIAHGDLQHGNVLVTAEGNPRLVDYDGMFVPRMRGGPAPELGHPSYQHPRRSAGHFSEALDHFSSLVIFLSLRALASDRGLWRFHNGDNLILSRPDLERPDQSAAFAALRATRDAAVRKLAEDLARFCGVDPAQVPSLEVAAHPIPQELLFPESLEAEVRAPGPPPAPVERPVPPPPPAVPPPVRPIRARPLPSRPPVSPRPRTVPRARPRTRRPVWVWGLAAAACLLGALGALLFLRRDQEPGPSSLAAQPVEAPAPQTGPSPAPKPSGGLPLAQLPAALAVPLGRGVRMELVLIRPGSFLMGAESGQSHQKPVHQLVISTPFYMGKYEVTQEQWEAVTGANPSRWKAATNPVETVTWDDCQAFVRRLNERVRGAKFALPTEAEWEYACRAGTATEFCGGDDPALLARYAWHSRSTMSDLSGQTHPVGQKMPNAWGLYDMHGNVWEWCEDPWHPSYEGAPSDGSAWLAGGDATARICRGGSWECGPDLCGSAVRHICGASETKWNKGLRLVLRDVGPEVLAVAQRVESRPAPPPSRRFTATAPGQAALELGATSMEFVLIRPGSFVKPSVVFSENPALQSVNGFAVPARARAPKAPPSRVGGRTLSPSCRVTLTKAFYLGKYEVTQEQWDSVMLEKPRALMKRGPRYPVADVSWEDCQAFLTALGHVVPGKRLRLPTEAEWEYASLAGRTTWELTPEELAQVGEQAWCSSWGGKWGEVHPVGEKKPNAWGLYDMFGNVWEWCQDWYGPSPEGDRIDPAGPPTGTHRLSRGGGFIETVDACVGEIIGKLPSSRQPWRGFRVALDAAR